MVLPLKRKTKFLVFFFGVLHQQSWLLPIHCLQPLFSSQNIIFVNITLRITLHVVYGHEKAINILKNQTPEDNEEKGK
jgi:hypothetical protein